jgi:hypothetical protein
MKGVTVRPILLAILLWPSLGSAQDIGEAEKTAALREAYRIAGPGASWGMVDVMNTTTIAKTLPDPVVVSTIPVKPIKVASAAPVEQNICTRHGKRKVMRNNGKSWRCK